MAASPAMFKGGSMEKQLCMQNAARPTTRVGELLYVRAQVVTSASGVGVRRDPDSRLAARLRRDAPVRGVGLQTACMYI